MWYIDENLLPNELIKYEWKIHTFYLVLMSIGVFIWFLFFIWWINTWAWFFGLAILLPFLYQVFYILTTEIVVTNKRVLYKTGVIARNVFELQLNKVESARLDQSILQRIIWAWTLIISWTWWHFKPIQWLAEPIEMRNLVYISIEEND